jgi:hypothetical protein
MHCSAAAKRTMPTKPSPVPCKHMVGILTSNKQEITASSCIRQSHLMNRHSAHLISRATSPKVGSVENFEASLPRECVHVYLNAIPQESSSEVTTFQDTTDKLKDTMDVYGS